MSRRTHKVLVSDKLAPEGVEVFRAADGIEVDVKVGLSPEDLAAIIGDYHGLVPDPAELIRRYREVRGLTELLCEPLSPEDCAAQSMYLTQPKPAESFATGGIAPLCALTLALGVLAAQLEGH